MESLGKILGIIKESIESLRWWALAAVLVCVYLRYSPEKYQPFVSTSYLMTHDRQELLGLISVVAGTVFLLGWIAAGLKTLSAHIQRQREEVAARRHRIQDRRDDRRKRKVEDRLRRVKNGQEMRRLSPGQLKLVRLALARPEGILKVSNDAALDVATMLVTRNVFQRIRPWYNERGGVIGEVFVVNDWVKEIEDERSSLSTGAAH